jgi:hypothetical protein
MLTCILTTAQFTTTEANANINISSAADWKFMKLTVGLSMILPHVSGQDNSVFAEDLW